MADKKAPRNRAPRKKLTRIELGQEPIWDIQFDETMIQYRAFCLYRDLLDVRSLVKVAEIWNRDPAGEPRKKGSLTTLQQWSSANRWVERAEAYDLHLMRKLMDARENEMTRMQRTEGSLGRTMVGLALSRAIGDPEKNISALDPNAMTPREVADLARAGVEISRLSTNRPTSLIKGAMLVTPAEFMQATGDIVEMLMRHIPDERKPIAAEEIRAYSAGERRMLTQ